MDSLASLMTTKIICCSISLVSCLFIITLYMILVIKTYFYKKVKHENTNQNNNSFIDSNDTLLTSFQVNRSTRRKSEKKKTRLGLGSHFVFFLSLSYVLNYISFFSYIRDTPNKEDSGCSLQAIFLNFFDMSAISWTACIGRVTLLGTTLVDIKRVNRSIFLFFIYAYVPSLVLSVG
jgi:hypothetical protein